MLFAKKLTLLSLFVAFNVAQASFLREISVKTANCTQCGMTFLGQLSAKVCGSGPAPSQCCVASNLRNSENNFVEGALDVFTGGDLKECYNYFLGNVTSSEDFSITIYHALTDGGTFDYVDVKTNDSKHLRCDFQDFLDGADFEDGKNCRLF